jgi:beta-galactosidase
MAGIRFPLIVRGGTLKNGHAVRYMFNYSATPQQLTVARAGTELLHDRKLASGQKIDLAAWDLAIVEEN